MIRISKCFRIVVSVLFVIVCFGFSFCYGAEEGKLYVLGMGPSAPDLTAPRALLIVEKADIILCSSHMQKRFREYIDPDKVITVVAGTVTEDDLKLKD